MRLRSNDYGSRIANFTVSPALGVLLLEDRASEADTFVVGVLRRP